MKRIALALFSCITGFLNAQVFEIPAQEFPYFQILEWKGQGAILLSRDLSFNQKQVHLTLISNGATSEWNENFNPSGTEFYYVSEDGGRYVYFLENLELKSGKISFHQLNIAGNVKATSVSFAPVLKKLGNFAADDLTLLDIVTSEKALIYLFTHTDNAAKKKSTIAITMMHNNFLVYGAVIAQTVTSSNREEDQVSWYMAGETGESIVYAARTHAAKDAGWLVKQFSARGDFQSEYNLKGTGTHFVEHERVGFGTRGSALLKRVEPVEKGTLLVNNGVYYVGGVEMDGTTANLVSYVWKNDVWNKLSSTPVKSYNAKKNLQVGYYPMKEGIGWFVKTAMPEGHFHPYGGGAGVVSGSVSQQINNPSRLLTDGYTGNFVAALADKWLVFSTGQLPSKGNVSFEYVAR